MAAIDTNTASSGLASSSQPSGNALGNSLPQVHVLAQLASPEKLVEQVAQDVAQLEAAISRTDSTASATRYTQEERRGSPRHSTKAVFAIAPYLPEQQLAEIPFTVVRGRNVSRTGVGLLSVTPFEATEVVVAMGGPGLNPIYVLANLVHCTEVGECEGQKLYLIGCRFVRRMFQ